MRKHGGTPSRRDKHVTLAAISPPGVAQGRFVGGHQSGLAGCKSPPLFKRRASSLRAHLDQVPLNYPSEAVVQPSSTAHFHYGFPTVEPLSWYSNKLLSSNLKTAIFQPCKRCHTP